jgi:class 3 adenylate cyclase
VARTRDRRILATLLFTDMVGSTRIAEELGDRNWRELLARHNRLIRAELHRYGGREVDTAGDGVFATFDVPASAIRAACAAVDSVRTLGVEIRSGVHVGECEVLDGKVSGVNVHVAARIMALADSGEVLVSGAVRDLVRGAGFGFADRGVHTLKGIDGDWQVSSVEAIERVPRPSALSESDARARRAEIEPPPLVARRGVRIALLATAAVLVAISAAFVLSRPHASAGPRRRPLRIRGEAAARLDPSNGRLLSVYGLPAAGSAITFADGSMWVITHGGTLIRVDEATGAVKTIGVQGDLVGVAAGNGLIWVLGSDGQLVRVDARSGAVGASAELQTAGTFTGLAFDEGTVWALGTEPYNAGTGSPKSRLAVYRIDPTTMAIVGHAYFLPTPFAGPTAIAAGEGAAWVASSGHLFRINAPTPTVGSAAPSAQPPPSGMCPPGSPASCVARTQEVDVTPIVYDAGNGFSIHPPVAVAVGPNGVWVATARGPTKTLYRIDPATDAVTATIPLHATPTAVATGPSGVWVSFLDGTTSEVDPLTAKVVATFPVGGIPAAIAVDPQNHLWEVAEPPPSHAT